MKGELEGVATCSYIHFMSITVSMREAKNRFTELARLAEAGETVTVTRNGKPVATIGSYAEPKKKGFDQEAGQRWMKENGYDPKEIWVAPDFDDPLPEDFLINPEHWPEKW
ncbi:MAG: type II toxin-antitoxin system prevent-host-death family antitoxin [Pseudomonadota bacterium]